MVDLRAAFGSPCRVSSCNPRLGFGRPTHVGNLRWWWNFLFCVPGLFYLVAAPLSDDVFVAVVAMLIIGVVWGALMGLVIFGTVGKPERGGP
jgi:hypothetical protein